MTEEQQVIFDLLMKKLSGTGTPESNELLNKKLKEFSKTPVAKQIIANMQSGLRTMEEWSCQDKPSMESIPEEIRNLKFAVLYFVSGMVTGKIGLDEVNTVVHMSLEAAYNFGLAESKRKKND